MLVLLPVFLLTLGALVILLLDLLRPNFAYSWLAGAAAAILTWATLLVFHWYPPAPFAISGWRPVEGLSTSILFHIDPVSWPYAVSLAGLAAAVVLSVPARHPDETHRRAWTSNLVLIGAGLLAVLAGNPLTLILAWMTIDLIELTVMLRSVNGQHLTQRAILAFAARVGGTLLVVWAMVASAASGEVLNFSSVAPGVGVFLLLASGLRLGVVPFHLPYTREMRLRRGFGTVLRLVAAASSLVVLGRLPPTVVEPGLAIGLLVFTTLASLYGSVMWLASANELNGRPYWLIALAGMALAAVIRGQPMASLAWGVAMILSGAMLFLYSFRRRALNFLPVLGVIGLAGLPYTPAVSGWNGLVVFPFTILDILLIIAHSLLLMGYIRLAFLPGSGAVSMDRWVQVIYSFGLLFLVFSQWVIGVRGWPASFSLGLWWAAAVSLLVAVASLLWLRRLTLPLSPVAARLEWLKLLSKRLGGPLAAFFRLDWFYAALWALYRLVQNLLQGLTLILEGDGGVLWAMLLLVLLITVVRAGGSP